MVRFRSCIGSKGGGQPKSDSELPARRIRARVAGFPAAPLTHIHFSFPLHTCEVALRVLIVDDEPAVRVALERALKLEGYVVGTASDGKDALVMLEQDPWDAVILDVMMPFMDGLETCRSLRARNDRTP